MNGDDGGNVGRPARDRITVIVDYLEINREAWNRRTRIHVDSQFYDVKGFLEGASTLNEIELEEVGPVEAKRLLHLQCHFGLDTLSWARMGAKVTGVDLSEEAIGQARELAEKAGLDARFICSDVYSFQDETQPGYDVVFSSYGALCWLPDMTRWAAVVASALRSGGRLHLVEFHPAIDLLTGFPYFSTEEPAIVREETYTENSAGEETTVATWSHSIGEVVEPLLGAGLRIESLREHSWSPYDCVEGLVRAGDRRWELRAESGNLVPLLYSIVARKS